MFQSPFFGLFFAHIRNYKSYTNYSKAAVIDFLKKEAAQAQQMVQQQQQWLHQQQQALYLLNNTPWHLFSQQQRQLLTQWYWQQQQAEKAVITSNLSKSGNGKINSAQMLDSIANAAAKGLVLSEEEQKLFQQQQHQYNQAELHLSNNQAEKPVIISNLSKGGNGKINKAKITLMAQFVKVDTSHIRDRYPLNKEFIMKWVIKNNGEHEWGNKVELVYFKGDEMLPSGKRNPVANAQKGQIVGVSAKIRTPDKPGRYRCDYRMICNGEYFGPILLVDIIVAELSEFSCVCGELLFETTLWEAQAVSKHHCDNCRGFLPDVIYHCPEVQSGKHHPYEGYDLCRNCVEISWEVRKAERVKAQRKERLNKG